MSLDNFSFNTHTLERSILLGSETSLKAPKSPRTNEEKSKNARRKTVTKTKEEQCEEKKESNSIVNGIIGFLLCFLSRMNDCKEEIMKRKTKTETERNGAGEPLTLQTMPIRIDSFSIKNGNGQMMMLTRENVEKIIDSKIDKTQTKANQRKQQVKLTNDYMYNTMITTVLSFEDKNKIGTTIRETKSRNGKENEKNLRIESFQYQGVEYSKEMMCRCGCLWLNKIIPLGEQFYCKNGKYSISEILSDHPELCFDVFMKNHSLYPSTLTVKVGSKPLKLFKHYHNGKFVQYVDEKGCPVTKIVL